MVARATLMWLDEPKDLHNTRDAGFFEDAVRAAGDHAGTGCGGLEKHAPAPISPISGGECAGPLSVHRRVLALLSFFLNCERTLSPVRTSPTLVASPTTTSGEREPATALPPSHAVDVDHARLTQWCVARLSASRWERRARPVPFCHLSLRIQTRGGFARGSASRDAAVIEIPAAVEDHGAMPSLAPRRVVARLFGSVSFRALLALFPRRSKRGECRAARSSLICPDVRAAKHGQTRTSSGASHRLAHARVSPFAGYSFGLGAIAHGLPIPHFAAFPALRCTCSPRYRTPLPL